MQDLIAIRFQETSPCYNCARTISDAIEPYFNGVSLRKIADQMQSKEQRSIILAFAAGFANSTKQYSHMLIALCLHKSKYRRNRQASS